MTVRLQAPSGPRGRVTGPSSGTKYAVNPQGYADVAAADAPGLLRQGWRQTDAVGYGAGVGGAVEQGTSRTTAVTLNKMSGAITLVSAAGSTTAASFTVNNSKVEATDVVVICQKSGTDKYTVSVSAVADGSFQVTFATKSGTTTEQPVFNFAVIKGAAS